MILPLITQIAPFESLSKVSDKYVSEGPEELGAQNLVTSVVVTYRGLDTLGEVTVLFIVTAGVGFFLRKSSEKKNEEKKREASEILGSGADVLLPLIFLFGAYIFIHGHLTPGGGFQGGVVVASGILLLMLSNVSLKLNHMILHFVESLSGASYVIIGVLGLILAGGFLDNRFLPLGEFGRLFSAGAIPIIYSLIGLKVGSELTGILENMRRAAE
jgi:multicomponent Na+:H+ antiporter subunit B